MPKVSEAHRAARREEIVDAATRVIVREGYRGASMSAVIAESGLSAGAIYGYFSGKQALFLAVAERVLDARQQDLETARDGGAPLSPGRMMRVVIGGLRTDVVAGVMPQIWAEAAVDAEVAEVAQRVLARVRTLLCGELTAWAAAEPGRVDGDPAEWAARVVPVVLAAAPGFLVQRLVVPGFDEEGFLAALDEAYRR